MLADKLRGATSGAQPAPPGQVLLTASGSWVVPAGVFWVSVVAVGAGQAGGVGYYRGKGGNGGSLAYVNALAVTPGETLAYSAPLGAAQIAANPGPAGGDSWLKRGSTVLVLAPGGGSATSGVGDVVNVGGLGGVDISTFDYGGGGGAAGYSGAGGAGSRDEGATPTAGAGGGGGGGYGGGNLDYGGGGGGGVGVLGQGASGAGGSSPKSSGSPGSGGEFSGVAARGGNYGGGGAAHSSASGGGGDGGRGAIRIIWPGNERQFPSTRTGNE